MALTFEQIIEKYRKNLTSRQDKEDSFERLIQAYFLTTPTYKNLLSDVWLWSCFPYKTQFETSEKNADIDIVCRTHDGEYWAVQCKCYQADKKIDKAIVDSFVCASSFEFETKDGKKTFSFRIWVDTTRNGFNNEANNVVRHLGIRCIGLSDLKKDNVDWNAILSGKKGYAASVKKYELYPHQKEAFNEVQKYFEGHERGKLIMACGTGKTFTSLRIAEAIANNSHLVLFLVPSIALLNQTLREWSAQCSESIYPICICSDSQASKRSEDRISDFILPATTDTHKIHKQLTYYKKRQACKAGMIVVFSTYQSIDVISRVQKEINQEKESFIFDLIISDEAHRTTGIKQKGGEQSPFTKVHSNENILSKKRLYMTATPRIYSTETKAKAKEKEVKLWSMDAPEWFGEEIYRIGFGEAVEKRLLSDYKVIILALDENSVDTKLLHELMKEKNIKESDAIKLIGCINVLSKRSNYLTDKEVFGDIDPVSMKSAVAFCSTIKNSIYLKDAFNVCWKAYYEKMSKTERNDFPCIKAEHIDGNMRSTVREDKLDWLKHAGLNKKECRILNNVHCLSEGIDVPNLDAIIFLSTRNSQVDVVQSVGRIMRHTEGKKFGYIIIPVIIPADKTAEDILNKSDDFKTVWSVLNALRSHDDRFNATINKIELNKKRPKIINVVGGGNFVSNLRVAGESAESTHGIFNFDELQQELYEKFQILSEQVFAKMVIKCGDKHYWANWGKDVGEIATRNVERISNLIAVNGEYKNKFNVYWQTLKRKLNLSVSQMDAVEMLSQHMITKPVFEALFGDDHFTKENSVSKSLEDIVTLLDEKSKKEDLEKLQRFYKSVQKRVEGIDNAEGKQKVVVELYDSFFKNALPMTVKKLGIVYTPIPVVDFIIHSVEWVLNKEFDRSISDENVNVIDPFTGTGTFIIRLLQLGVIKKKDLERKYRGEIFANELVLLAYYIASVNIENAYHDVSGQEIYEPFSGISLVDTFQTYEDSKPTLDDRALSRRSNSEQKKQPVTIIVGNPPYSIGQKSANDNAQNQTYEKLQQKIADTYVALSNAKTNKATHDSYIKAFRWASDELDKTNGGIIAFITNSGWIDGKSQDGFRKQLYKDFDSIYVLNLRGAKRGKLGEIAEREGDNIFDIMSGVAITILVKKNINSNSCNIYYHDIGNYKSRMEKLNFLVDSQNIGKLSLSLIVPNEHGDWVSKRSDIFGTWIPIEANKKFNSKSHSFFTVHSLGVNTNRDNWVYGFSKEKVSKNMQNTIAFYNQEVKGLKEAREKNSALKANDFKSNDRQKISWCSSLIPKLNSLTECNFQKDLILLAHYRPFVKKHLYFGEFFIHRKGQFYNLFPTPNHKNLVICVTGVAFTKTFTTLISDCIIDLGFQECAQCFPLYWYETTKQGRSSSFAEDNAQIKRHDAISNFILSLAQSKYGNKVQKEDIFYYVYGILHSKSYREVFAGDLKRMLPRIPLVREWKKFWDFSKAGRALADLHLNYESFPSSPAVEVVSFPYSKKDIQKYGKNFDGLILENANTEVQHDVGYKYYAVEKMKFPKKDDKSIILYNQYHMIRNIPKKAYEYVVNGKSAIEWIMMHYAITNDKKSGIVQNPNDWAEEHKKPRYILDLLLSVINVSLKTLDIVTGLPEIEWNRE